MSFTHNSPIRQVGKGEIIQLGRFVRLTGILIYFIKQAKLNADHELYNAFTRSILFLTLALTRLWPTENA